MKKRNKFDKNEIIVDGNIAYIVLYNKNNEEVARTKIDAFNVELVSNIKWYLRPDGYVATNNYNGKYKYLHKLICSNNNKIYVDHKDRDRLNNTVENLRSADDSENGMNKGIRSNNTSGKVGVHWSRGNKKWCAMICVKGKHINLGYFDDYNEAVKCRIDAEHKYFKDFKVLNERKVGVLC